ncbi:MAG: DUF885 domain-containing protein [Gemmatimonadales bacterium]|nr:DUF885 domain-containing protein [Gemmatimonadales bacterium]
MKSRLLGFGAAFLLQGAPPVWTQTGLARLDSLTPAERVTRLADTYVREYRAAYPELALLSGFTLARHDGLSDNSLAALAAWRRSEDQWWKEVSAVDPASLWGRPEWITYGFLHEALRGARETRVCRSELWPVSQLSGWQALFTLLADIQPVGSEEHRSQALARWGRLPRYLERETANLRTGVKLGYTTPRHNVELAVAQLERILALSLEESPFYAPARRDSTPEFRSSWKALLSGEINPAVRRYVAYLRSEYLGQARRDIAISAHPRGRDCYQVSFRAITSLNRSPRETFSRGQERVAKNEREMGELGRKELGTEDVATLLKRVDTDTANRFRSREEMLAFTETVVARAKAALPRWFGRLPKAPATVRPHPDFLGADAPDQYNAPAQDGSRPGVYLINLNQPEKKLRSRTEVTAFHELYPGHHLQIALAQEQPATHPISQLVGTTAFAEGWGRYAESLAEEMGLYTTTYARIARRSWPAHGMVVDPGLHLFGWTRDSAIRYVRNGGWPEAESLVDRVVVWPGQLTAYDTGALELMALREQAQRELGERFDIREFHDRVLANGAITLPMLRQIIEHWIAEKKRS